MVITGAQQDNGQVTEASVVEAWILRGGTDAERSLVLSVAQAIGVSVTRVVASLDGRPTDESLGNGFVDAPNGLGKIGLGAADKGHDTEKPEAETSEPVLWVAASESEFAQWYRKKYVDPTRSPTEQRSLFAAGTRYWNWLDKAIRHGFRQPTPGSPPLPKYVITEKVDGNGLSVSGNGSGPEMVDATRIVDSKPDINLELAGLARFIVTAASKFEGLRKSGTLEAKVNRAQMQTFKPYGWSITSFRIFAHFCQDRYSQVKGHLAPDLRTTLDDLFTRELSLAIEKLDKVG